MGTEASKRPNQKMASIAAGISVCVQHKTWVFIMTLVRVECKELFALYVPRTPPAPRWPFSALTTSCCEAPADSFNFCNNSSLNVEADGAVASNTPNTRKAYIIFDQPSYLKVPRQIECTSGILYKSLYSSESRFGKVSRRIVGKRIDGSPLSSRSSPATSMILSFKRYLEAFPAAESTPLGDQENLYRSGLSARTKRERKRASVREKLGR